MPAKSKSQKRLFSWSYACKKGYTKDCPENVNKIAQAMTAKQLRKFFEGIIYKTTKANKDLLNNFLAWLDEKNIDYLYSDDVSELEIYNEFTIKEDDFKNLKDFINKLGLEKMWEDAPVSGATDTASLANINGQGAVRPPSSMGSSSVGSGDRFDNKTYKKKKKTSIDDDVEVYDDEEDDEEINKKEKYKSKKHNKSMKEDRFLSYDEFVNEGKIITKRKYTDKYPQKIGYSNTSVRNKVLDYLANEGSVTAEKIKEFFSLLEEQIGRRPSIGWLRDNKHLVKKYVNENGETAYKLTKRGSVVNKRIKDFESKNNIVIGDNINDEDIEYGTDDDIRSKIENRKQEWQ